jgi:hypothetical protein
MQGTLEMIGRLKIKHGQACKSIMGRNMFQKSAVRLFPNKITENGENVLHFFR